MEGRYELYLVGEADIAQCKAQKRNHEQRLHEAILIAYVKGLWK